jgi:hypothetical protein
VFAASLASATTGNLRDRLALLSSQTGDLLRWLTLQSDRSTDGGVERAWRLGLFRQVPGRSQLPVRFTQPGDPPGAGHRGRAQLVQAGASDYAVSPDGRAVAYVIRADHGDVVEIVARNLVTERRNIIIAAARPAPGANNWPPDVTSLTWAPDDVHLAVEFSLAAAINSLLVFDAFTATTAGDGWLSLPAAFPEPLVARSRPAAGWLGSGPNGPGTA